MLNIQTWIRINLNPAKRIRFRIHFIPAFREHLLRSVSRLPSLGWLVGLGPLLSFFLSAYISHAGLYIRRGWDATVETRRATVWPGARNKRRRMGKRLTTMAHMHNSAKRTKNSHLFMSSLLTLPSPNQSQNRDLLVLSTKQDSSYPRKGEWVHLV